MEHALNWQGPFSYPGMVRIDTLGGGSCLFHAIVNSYFVPYRIGTIDGRAFDRIKFVEDIRSALADKLASEASPGRSYYDVISRGKLRSMSSDMPEYSLAEMQRKLRSRESLGNTYNELISEVLGRDIYILDASSKDVYVVGDDADILYKNRPSTVVLIEHYGDNTYYGGHYELVGIRTPQGLVTSFSPEHSFIRQIRARIRERIAIGSRRKNGTNYPLSYGLSL